MSFGDDAAPPVQSRTPRSRLLRALAALDDEQAAELAAFAERLATWRVTEASAPERTGNVDPIANWPTFAEQIRRRLEAGAREYGDASLRRPMPELVDEIIEELADVCGWSCVLVARLEALRGKVANAEMEKTP